jgi:tRNA pseudouridine38-40 synthase
MARYFIEVNYKGTRYSGFQIQENAITIQSEVQKALHTFYREKIELTGSSRTDAGVHALQNYFHFDTDLNISAEHLYNLNSILPADISVQSLKAVRPDAHSRFQAISRSYEYRIYNKKNPFFTETAWYYPYSVDLNALNETSALLIGEHNFQSFAKRNSQVHTYICRVIRAEWTIEGEQLLFRIEANRFLRGMVRALTATQLKVGRQLIDHKQFTEVIRAQDCTYADFSAPGHGLYLVHVKYPPEIFV